VLQFKCCTCMLYSSSQVGMDAGYFTLVSSLFSAISISNIFRYLIIVMLAVILFYSMYSYIQKVCRTQSVIISNCGNNILYVGNYNVVNLYLWAPEQYIWKKIVLISTVLELNYNSFAFSRRVEILSVLWIACLFTLWYNLLV